MSISINEIRTQIKNINSSLLSLDAALAQLVGEDKNSDKNKNLYQYIPIVAPLPVSNEPVLKTTNKILPTTGSRWVIKFINNCDNRLYDVRFAEIKGQLFILDNNYTKPNHMINEWLRLSDIELIEKNFEDE